MNNIILIIIEVIVCYTALLILNKKYKTDGIYVYAIIATFISCIMSLKQIDILGIAVPTGLGVTTSLILAGNLITQKRGPEELKTYLTLILVTSLISCCFLNLSGLMESSNYNKFANKAYDSIFKYNLRVYIALIISVLSTTYFGSKIYYSLKRLENNIIISNIFSLIIVESLENISFILIAYLFEYEVIDLILCLLFRYMIKTIIGVLGTIPLYIANRFN